MWVKTPENVQSQMRNVLRDFLITTAYLAESTKIKDKISNENYTHARVLAIKFVLKLNFEA